MRFRTGCCLVDSTEQAQQKSVLKKKKKELRGIQQGQGLARSSAQPHVFIFHGQQLVNQGKVYLLQLFEGKRNHGCSDSNYREIGRQY